jgi:hypothetical protein
MRNDPAGKTFEERIETAKAQGKAGRRELLDRLARMPMEKVVKLPASSLAILGPEGLTRLAAMREELAGAARKVGKSTQPPKSSRAGQTSPRGVAHPIRSTALVVLSILIAGLLLDLAWPVLSATVFESGGRSYRVSQWPACQRLDSHVDGCVYTSGSDRLSLTGVAGLTGIPVENVLAANRHLPASADTVLPRGSRIVVWRGRLRLEGDPQ